MDPSLVLEQTIQDVSNLQEEFQYILEEIRRADTTTTDHKKKFSQKDLQIQKFIKHNGSTTANPNEEQIAKEARNDITDIEKLQDEKCTLANTALFLVSRHLAKLEKSMKILEDDGVLPLAEDEVESGTEFSRESSVLSTTERKKRVPLIGTSVSPVMKKKKTSRSASTQRHPDLQRQPSRTPDLGTLDNVPKVRTNEPKIKGDRHSFENDEEDKTLYCFCQRVSFGEMVACDGPNCKYEWFHYTCVDLKEPPKGTWYCPDCRQDMAKNKLKRKRN